VAKEYKPGFIYIRSDLLDQEVAFSIKTGWLFCEDGVRYSPAELEILGRNGGVLEMVVHRVKRVLGGEVVELGKRNENENSSTGKHNTDGANQGGTKHEQEVQAELEIY